MRDIIVRPETSDDIKAIDVVNISAFQEEDEARLVAELRQLPGYTADLSLVAEFSGRIVGHLMLTPVTFKSPERETRILALGPMSVVPSQSHRGIGSELVKAAIECATRMNYGAIIVVGHPDFYSRFGFEEAAKWDVTSNLPAPDEAVRVFEIKDGTLRSGGVVTYPQPFLSLY